MSHDHVGGRQLHHVLQLTVDLLLQCGCAALSAACLSLSVSLSLCACLCLLPGNGLVDRPLKCLCIILR